MPIWSQVCLVPAAVLFTLLLPVRPTVLLPARQQFPNGIEWVSSWLSILLQGKPMFFFIPMNFPFLASGWLSLFSLDRMQLPIAFQQSLIEHASGFFFPNIDTLSLTQSYRARSIPAEEQGMVSWLKFSIRGSVANALKQNNKHFPLAACGLLLGCWVIKLHDIQPVGNQLLHLDGNSKKGSLYHQWKKWRHQHLEWISKLELESRFCLFL